MNRIQYQIGTQVQMKKTHACGNDVFCIIGTGADVKLRCVTCSRIIVLPYETFIKRVKRMKSDVSDKA